MRRFWDARAHENPLYFIDNRLDYADPDVERFFQRGERSLDAMPELREVAAEAGMRVERVEGEGNQFCFVLLHRGA